MFEHVPPIFTLIVVILVARSFGLLFKKIGQPSVMGEVLGGIVLGPSLIGHVFPGVMTGFFHPEAMNFLSHIAELGIILYLFIMALVTTFMTGPLLQLTNTTGK